MYIPTDINQVLVPLLAALNFSGEQNLTMRRKKHQLH
jgi:hypothetical protein